MENNTSQANNEIMFAVFDGGEEISEAMYEEIKQFATYIKQQESILR